MKKYECNETIEKLIEKNMELVDKVIEKSNFDLNEDEMRSYGIEGLWKAIVLYDPDKHNTTFNTYASKAIYTHINKLNEIECKSNRLKSLLLDDLDDNIDNYSSSRYDELLLIDIIRGIDFSHRELLILNRLLYGYKMSEIAKELDLSMSYIWTYITRIRRKVKVAIYKSNK